MLFTVTVVISTPYKKLKSGHYSLFIPTFHFSTIPLFHGLPIGKHHPSGVKSKPGLLGQDSLL
jgi:hypothetical protein